MILRYLLPIGIIHRGLAKLYLFLPLAIWFSFKYLFPKKHACNKIQARPWLGPGAAGDTADVER